MELKQQVIKGVSWNFLEQIIRQVISIAVTAILARILSPNDYGLVALSTIFVGFICLFENLSIGAALIQKSSLNERYISTSFWTGVLTGFVLAITLCIIAPFAAMYFDQPLLRLLIFASALSLLISPISSTHRALLAKDLEFDKLSLLNMLSALLGGVASLLLAIYGLGVWSLVLSDLISIILVTPLAWYFKKWRPRLIFDKECFKELFSFSAYLLSFNILNYFARNADNLIVGKFLGANVLGIYSMAYNLMMKPLRQVSWSITSVLFPAFSSIQGDISRIRSAYVKVVWVIALITFPMMMGLMMVAREFILVVVGPKWEGVILPLQVLCLVGVLQSIGTTVGSVFTSLGRADLQFKIGSINAIGFVVGFLICIQWGLMGLIKGYLVANIIFVSLSLCFALRLIHLSIKDFLLVLKMPFINSVIMVFALMGYRYIDGIYFQMNNFLNLVTSVTLGVTVYSAFTMFFLEKTKLNELKGMLKINVP